MSQLDWDINNVPIIKLGASWDINNNWTLKGRFWSAMTDNADMTDRDWVTSTQSTPTDISRHPDTQLKEAYEIDINITYWFISQ